jgi:hypothetical protein
LSLPTKRLKQSPLTHRPNVATSAIFYANKMVTSNMCINTRLSVFQPIQKWNDNPKELDSARNHLKEAGLLSNLNVPRLLWPVQCQEALARQVWLALKGVTVSR